MDWGAIGMKLIESGYGPVVVATGLFVLFWKFVWVPQTQRQTEELESRALRDSAIAEDHRRAAEANLEAARINSENAATNLEITKAHAALGETLKGILQQLITQLEIERALAARGGRSD